MESRAVTLTGVEGVLGEPLRFVDGVVAAVDGTVDPVPAVETELRAPARVHFTPDTVSADGLGFTERTE